MNDKLPIIPDIAVLKPEEVSTAVQFIKTTEGNNPIVDDLRKSAGIKDELTPEEFDKQNKASEIAFDKYLKES